MKKWYMVVLLTLVLSGCAAVQAGKSAVVGKAAEIVQDGLTDAEWFVCKAAPVGSVMDRYGKTDERAAEWKDFCFPGADSVNLIAPQ